MIAEDTPVIIANNILIKNILLTFRINIIPSIVIETNGITNVSEYGIIIYGKISKNKKFNITPSLKCFLSINIIHTILIIIEISTNITLNMSKKINDVLLHNTLILLNINNDGILL